MLRSMFTFILIENQVFSVQQFWYM